MKARQALANVTRSAALAAMALVIFMSLHAGVELVFAVARGMLSFLIVHWVLGAIADVVAVAAFRPAPPPAAPEETVPPQP